VSDNTTGNDGRNVVVFRNTTNGSALASTYSWSSNGVRIDSDIVFWDAAYQFVAGASDCSRAAFIEDVAAHELGHSLGLGHSAATDATMYSTYTWCSQQWRTLSSDDIAGIKSLYPSVSTSVPTAPSSLAASTSSSSALNVSWSDNSGNESGFTLQRSLDGVVFVTIAELSANVRTYGDAGLLPSTRYYYRVAAYNSAGSSAYSNTGSGTTATALTNTVPVVSITAPASGASYPSGASVTFTGSASDSQDGTLSSALAWSSNIDGSLGTGASLSRVLSGGTHTITARVTDSGGLTGAKQVTMSVATSEALKSSSTLTVSTYKVKGFQKADLRWSGISSSSSVDVYRNGSKVATTSNDGSHTDNINAKGGGTHQYKVCESGTSSCSNTALVAF
jgi:hypothetical protein